MYYQAKRLHLHNMGLNEPAKYHLSPKTSEDYADVLEAAASYLEGYDEVYVITEADIRALGLPTKEEDIAKLDKSMIAEAIIGHGDLLDRLRENGDKEQLSQLEKQASFLLLPKARASVGPFVIPIETLDRSEMPFRAGFVFLTGPQLNETLLLPKGASIDDLLKFFSRDNLSTTGFINKIALAHELGHLKLNHSATMLVRSSFFTILTITILGADINSLGAIPIAIMQANYSQEDEAAADKFAVEFLKRKKISPIELANALHKLSDGHDDPEFASYFSSHPLTQDRIAMIKAGL